MFFKITPRAIAGNDPEFPVALSIIERIRNARFRDRASADDDCVFRLDSLVYDPEKREIADFSDGLRDIGRGIVGTVGEPRECFMKKPSAMLEAVGLCALLGFSLDPAAADAIPGLAATLSRIPPESVRDGLSGILAGPRPDKAFEMLSGLGILKATLPEVEAMRGVTQPPEFHPEGDVFEHTLLMLSRIAFPGPEIGWTLLLHDVGKPSARSVEPSGRIRFFGHDAIGAVMARKILERLKMPPERIKNIVSAIAGHMRFSHVGDMRPAKWRGILDNPNFPLELELHRIDCAASHGMMDNHTLMLDRAAWLAEKRLNEPPEPFVGGGDLIRMGFKPGPVFGEILSHMLEIQSEGTLKSRAEALKELEKTAKRFEAEAAGGRTRSTAKRPPPPKP